MLGLVIFQLKEWFQDRDIGLTNGLDDEWSYFMKSLSSAGIEFFESNDTMILSRDEKRGTPTTNLA